jgi:phosphatidylserine/phosphatidylglycerophosphate/cardiolipin synthase-like enzyme
MKLHIKLVGTFNRTPINSSPAPEAVTLQQWMQSHLSVATQVRQRTPLLLRQFGMNFLSESSIERLLQQAHQTEAIENNDLIPLWLQPLEAIEAKPILYRYEFVSEEAKIQLQPDDPQLPYWETDNIAGAYEIVVEENSYPGVSQTWLDSIWLKVKQEWENYSSCDCIQMALQSPDSQFSFYLSDIPRVKVSIDIEQLTPEMEEAISFLRQQKTDIEISSAADALVKEYQQEFISTPIDFSLPEEIKPETFAPAKHQFIIGKKTSRKAIEELINQAEKFLFISSYIIEDRSITELICQKATILPQGVWILTDLNNEVIDAIDTQVEENPRSREAYQHSDEKKAQCLKLLLDAGARIRGGAFHLKTYITEKAGYLGSCNLTGGSLDFNLESGLICQGTSTHRELVQYFTSFWQYKTKYDVFPSIETGKFIQRTLNHSSPIDRFLSQTLLTPKQYRKDLYEQLNKYSGKVAIYSRGFAPDEEILHLLSSRSTRIYADSFIRNQNSRITTHSIRGIHAKVTLIDDRVAYLGGVNFQFAREFSLTDLMYKTCDRKELTQIRQQLAVSF